MNTRFVYRYSSSGGAVEEGEVVFRGTHSARMVEDLTADLEEGCFIASQVGVLELFPWLESGVEDGDHCWHELVRVEHTRDHAGDARAFSEFVDEVAEASFQGWESFDPASRAVQLV